MFNIDTTVNMWIGKPALTTDKMLA